MPPLSLLIPTIMDFDKFESLLKSDRSIRRFDASRPVDAHMLERLVSLVRYCASGRNLQPLKYKAVSDAITCDEVFSHLKWAGYYTDWDGPSPSERPVAYLVQCLDTSLTADPMCDEGLQLQAITLGAAAMGLGGCIIKSFNAPAISRILGLADNLKPVYVLALGYPAEETRIVPLVDGSGYKYYRDADDVQCVPKRPLSELLIPDSGEGE